MAQQWGAGIFILCGALTVGSLLLLFLPVWDQKVKTELVAADSWYIGGCQSWGTQSQRGKMAKGLNKSGWYGPSSEHLPSPHP